MNKINLAPEGIASGVHPRIFRSKPVGDVCLDIAKFAENHNCRTLEYLLKLAATEAYECLDEPADPPSQLKSVGMWDWDVSSNLVYADATTAGLFGVDPEQSRRGLDRHHFEVNIYADDMPKYASALSAAVSSGGEFEARYRIATNGSLTWVYAKGSCLLSIENAPTRFPGALFEM